MTIEFYSELREDIEKRLNKADSELKKFPVNKLGLVNPTSDYIKAKKVYNLVFNELRTLNKNTPKSILYKYSRRKRKY